MVYGIFRRNAKPNSKHSRAIPVESGFKTKASANKFLAKMRVAGVEGFKVVKLN